MMIPLSRRHSVRQPESPCNKVELCQLGMALEEDEEDEEGEFLLQEQA